MELFWQIFLSLSLLLAAFGIAWLLFSPFAFIYSALFSRRKHSKMLDELRGRIGLTVEKFGRDPLTNKKSPAFGEEISEAMYIQSNYVLGPGWFNQFIAGYHSLIGGKINSFDDILTLARQNCLQSLREQASEGGYDEVINVRLQTSRISALTGGKSQNKFIEIFAYGTAVKYS
ncbi:MAG: YbjQ family protein [Candidatus Thalassarchaeaceae archaeon]|nr:MAG: hypothetical protein CND66_05220 [Marine Group II euryarchaeote MED-G37]